jgi:hypothetical protein
VLPETMLVDYEGEVDLQYPGRLAERIRLLQRQPHLMDLRFELPEQARTQFSYDVLSQLWSKCVAKLVP